MKRKPNEKLALLGQALMDTAGVATGISVLVEEKWIAIAFVALGGIGRVLKYMYSGNGTTPEAN